MTETTQEINKYKFVGGVVDGEMRPVVQLVSILHVAVPDSQYYGLEDTVPQTFLKRDKTHKYYRMDAVRHGELVVEYVHESVYKLYQQHQWREQDAKRIIREIRKQVGKLESVYYE